MFIDIPIGVWFIMEHSLGAPRVEERNRCKRLRLTNVATFHFNRRGSSLELDDVLHLARLGGGIVSGRAPVCRYFAGMCATKHHNMASRRTFFGKEKNVDDKVSQHYYYY